MDKDLIKSIRETVKATSCGTVVMSAEEYQKLMLQLSAMYEGARAEARELRSQNAKLETVTMIMSGYINDNLELFENLFESDEGFCDGNKEQMMKYIIIARYMRDRYGRQGISDRVEERMMRLPF